MKKLLIALMGFAIVGIANADTPTEAPPMQMDPVCKQAFEHMRDSRPKVEAAIKANDANKVGTLVIADHKYMEDFMSKNPQCKPPMPPKR
ncbi:MAG: hypothetical protein PHC75_09870 [Burkholderiales bacterium]|nr:hypothetical protein [Burkholderiales bacterium]